MPKWMKYVVSAGAGFLGAFATAKGTGASNAGAAIVGAVGTLTSLGNLQATSPGDHKALGREN